MRACAKLLRLDYLMATCNSYFMPWKQRENCSQEKEPAQTTIIIFFLRICFRNVKRDIQYSPKVKTTKRNKLETRISKTLKWKHLLKISERGKQRIFHFLSSRHRLKSRMNHAKKDVKHANFSNVTKYFFVKLIIFTPGKRYLDYFFVISNPKIDFNE